MDTTAKPTILIVEDDAELASVTAEHLLEAGMHTQVFNSVGRAEDYLKKHHVNLVLLDINLPDASGFTLLESLREGKNTQTPVIFVTGSAEEDTKIKGFETGADDYVTKPFSAEELVARIKAVMRRTDVRGDMDLAHNVSVSDEPFTFLGANVVGARLEIHFPDGAVESVGRKEIGILAHLARFPGKVVPRKNLIHAVWGPHADLKSRSLDQYVVKIRELFKKHGANVEPFRTVHGVGFIYDQNEN